MPPRGAGKPWKLLRRATGTCPISFPAPLGAFRTDSQLTASMAALVEALGPQGREGMNWVKLAIADTQSFARHDTFDIQDFAEKLKMTATSDTVARACDQVLSAFSAARVHSIALGKMVEHSHGLAFWYPTTQYAYLDVVDTYRKLAYDQNTKWTAYLAENRFAA